MRDFLKPLSLTSHCAALRAREKTLMKQNAPCWCDHGREAHLVPFRTRLSPERRWYWSKSVGEQDVADQQGGILCREDLTFVGSSFVRKYSK